jgi:chemotaxis signal transduction protein
MSLAEQTALAIAAQPVLTNTEECVVFALSSQTYAVAAGQLRTCLSLPRLTALDDTAEYLVGAFDLRGELVPVVSPAVLIGAPLKPAATGDLLILVDAGDYPVALHADAVLGLERVRSQDWDRADRVQTLSTLRIVLSGGRARLIDPTLIGLVLEASGPESAEARLKAFEQQLDAADLSLLEARAERYRALGPARRAMGQPLGRCRDA